MLTFDVVAARRYGPIVVARDKVGSPIAALDPQIAAICLAHDAHFEGTEQIQQLVISRAISGMRIE